MRNILIFACLAGLAAAISIYFVSENIGSEDDFLPDGYSDAYDID